MNFKSAPTHLAFAIAQLVFVNWHICWRNLHFFLPLVTHARQLYSSEMAIARILVDGFSLLHAWRDLAPDEPRHSATARDELIKILTQYRDTTGTPLSIIFDGNGAPPGTPEPISPEGVEVLYSKKGKTADDLIERTAYRLKPYGEALVITNDYAERDTVMAMGGLAHSCEEFIHIVQDALWRQDREIDQHNRSESLRFKRPR